jgi:hypothetical protein
VRPMPLDAPVMTMIWSESGFNRTRMPVDAATLVPEGAVVSEKPKN